MTLKDDILAWDQKSAADIGAVFDRHVGSVRLSARLISLAGDQALERGATWLLKRGIESKQITLTDDQADGFFALTATITDWGAGLHVMQCMPFLRVPRSQSRRVSRFLDQQLTDRRAIVRAWAYWGYHELATAHPAFRAEAESLLRDAAETESAGSVRVRVRRAMEARGLA